MVKMWLDDVRPPWRHGRIGWEWVKTYDEAVALLKTGNVEECSLDHDLTIPQTMGEFCPEKTGYDVVCWMEENDVWPVKGTHIHSMNPSGSVRMRQVVERYSHGVCKPAETWP